MSDRPVSDVLDQDARQELKEAVCDAVLERLRRVVSGEGAYGELILGDRPSRVLTSGFLLPGVNVDGDDETGDIHISSHGLDLRVRDATGTLIVRPCLSVYVRALPTSDELFARNGRLIPKADFSPTARNQINQTIRGRAAAEIPQDAAPEEKVRRRGAITREVYVMMGVDVPATAQLPGGDDRDISGDGSGSALPPPPVVSGRLRIPNAISCLYEIPQKWLRIPVDVPPLELPLPCDPADWAARAQAHSITINQAIRGACVQWLQSPDGDRDAWRRTRPPSEAFWEPARWDAFLATARQLPRVDGDVIPPIDAGLLVQALPEPASSGWFSVRIALESLRENNEDRECAVFGVSVEVELPEAALGPIRLERVRRSYHLAGFMTMPAIGVNGGVSDLGVHMGRRRLRTTWMPRYVLPRMRARHIPSVPTAYARLADTSMNVAILAGLPDRMDEWREQVAATQVLSAPDEDGSPADEAAQRVRFQDDLHSWQDEAERVRKGCNLLTVSYQAWRRQPDDPAAIPYRAWVLLNQTFADANPRSALSGAPGWRLFQLAFVLAHLPTLASRLPSFHADFDAHFDEDAASLLYMSTGGGKTEAFFGIIVFALFFDRLRGKKRGITAMMHYPLRLLTVQQAQRLARLLARAEMIRHREALGGAPFEIGFWVGSSNTPNRTEGSNGSVDSGIAFIPAWNDARARNEDALLTSDAPDDRAYVAAKEAWNKLPTCPFCGSNHGTALRRFPEKHQALGIVCVEPNCPWNLAQRTSGTRAPVPLPFWVADTDIYRRAPSVLLGTIDKLALLGQDTHTISKIASMFGLARWRQGGSNGTFEMPLGAATSGACPASTERVAPAFADGVEAFHDPFPSLIVQDEMHLLEESLGTFGGIFETGLMAWFKHITPLLGDRACRWPGAPDQPRLPHIIGATATAADAAKHVRAIYTRRVAQFPHPGPGLHDGFYVGLAEFSEGSSAAVARVPRASPRERERAAPWGRVYASLMTNGRRHTVTTLSVLATHAATISRWQRDLAATDIQRRSRAVHEMINAVSDAPWSERRRSALRSAAAAGQFAILAEAVDLHRIMLTYVTNKKGGDQVLSALEPAANETHEDMGSDYHLSDYRTTLISGGVDIGTIQEVIRSAEADFDPMRDDISQSLRCIVATSAISHGVDVEAFNAMSFAGMPADIAEYIQASSRVGRRHVGFSLLIPTPQTRRDRFVVEVHESFHRLLERMIAPPAVERWADRAIERTIPSLVQTWLAGVYHQRQFVAASTSRKGDVPFPNTVDIVKNILSTSTAFEQCVAFVQEAIAVEMQTGRGGPVNPQYYRDLVRQEVERIYNTVASGAYVGSLAEFWRNRWTNLRHPMTSLRDVDEPGRISAARRTTDGRTVAIEQVAATMAMIRNRGAGRLRRAVNSETDSEA